MSELEVQLHLPCCDNLNEFHKGYCVLCSQTKLTAYPCPTIQEAQSTLMTISGTL